MPFLLFSSEAQLNANRRSDITALSQISEIRDLLNKRSVLPLFGTIAVIADVFKGPSFCYFVVQSTWVLRKEFLYDNVTSS